MAKQPSVTLKNTKAEILEALSAAQARIQEAEKGKLNPERMEKEKVEKKAVESTKEAVEKNIFSKELMDKFNDLQIAISAEEARLQELYGVGKELQKLALTVEAGQAKLDEIEAEKVKKTEEAKINLDNLQTEYSQKKATALEEHELTTKKLKQERSREQEEYTYKLQRSREKDNNSWDDEKAARELEMTKREEKLATSIKEIDEKAGYIKELEEKVKEMPDKIEAEKKTACDALAGAMAKKYEHKMALAEKDSSATIGRLEDKVSYIERELDVANKSNETLQSKLDKAYSELRELATKTVESASGVKLIGTASNQDKK